MTSSRLYSNEAMCGDIVACGKYQQQEELNICCWVLTDGNLCRSMGWNKHCCDVIWPSEITRNSLMLTTKRWLKLRIIGPLRGKSASERSVPFTNGHWWGKYFHIMTSWYWPNTARREQSFQTFSVLALNYPSKSITALPRRTTPRLECINYVPEPKSDMM